MTTVTISEMETKVKDFLKSLGAGPNKIAENLKEMKIKGYKSDAYTCPIAKVIKKNFKNLKEIVVDGCEIEFTYCKENCCVGLPNAVAKFIEKFDNNDYPELAFKEAE